MCRPLILDMFHESYTLTEGVGSYWNQDVMLFLMWIIHDLGIPCQTLDVITTDL
jgi:hypothetical protein